MNGIDLWNRISTQATVVLGLVALALPADRAAMAQVMEGGSPCGGSADEPCPNLLETPCGEAGPGGHGGGLARICDCACGGGWWNRTTEKALLFPMRPMMWMALGSQSGQLG